MDPEMAAAAAIEAFEKGDFEMASEALEDLHEWFKRGGFPLKPQTQMRLLKAFLDFGMPSSPG